ncbi:hypothetical protein [Aliarcobacter skirrowii]|uniref:Transcriptional regulator n=1 Tax=Aliarcobacter skirrowii TaxID=28200 RepID=A0AAW9DCC5_9BACT|nr:hypothetical protein [Aliarcobacter skirrowii]MDX4069923.1 hypothetical protein [Aliarcobacter skirrowii]
MDEEKFEFYLNKIEAKFPNRTKLNQGEMLQCINKSRSTFNRIIKANDLHKIPKISSKEEFKRKSAQYYTYQFDVYDIAKFLAK